MPKLSPEERSRVNRENGRKGGPRTPEGQDRCRRNSLC